MMNVDILLRLIFSHFLGDFLLQPDWMCRGKQAKGKKKYLFLALHSAVMSSLAYLFVADWGCWQLPTVIFVTHYLIDLFKPRFETHKTAAFIVDQLLHLLVLFFVWVWLFSPDALRAISEKIASLDEKIWVYLICYILILRPTSLFLSLFVRKWTPADNGDKSLPSAGKWIGYLERVLILTFIFTHNVEGVGFLLAAKSIFRFGELSKATEIRTTEYVLIGTFASFAIAILIGFAAIRLMNS